MKTSATLLAILLTTGAAAAQQRPDYSKDAIQRLVMDIYVDEPSVRYYPDSVRFNALGTSWNFHYLPGAVMRLSGTELGVGVTQQMPNPFLLTNTVLATSPRAARRGRELSRELKKINKRLNATIKVETK
jgi:hypothetical protein